MLCDIKRFSIVGLFLLLIMLVGSACSGAQVGSSSDRVQSASNMLFLPEVQPAQLNNRPLRVIATTSIIGDVVANVGGGDIELKTLMTPGQDPHSFKPSAAELTGVSIADVIFVNGWDLEEGLVDDLATIAGDKPVVAVGANIEPLEADGETHNADDEANKAQDHGQVDPHTWFSVPNVEQWVENIVQILSDLDPAHRANFEKNAQVYLLELEHANADLHRQIAEIPAEKRILVTNHGVFNYFAQEYGLRVVGTVIPSISTQAEPSAGELAQLIKDMERSGVCTIFTDIAANDDLANTIAKEINDCDEVKIIPLYTGSLGTEGSGADNYIGMLKVNLDRIEEGLK